MAADMVVNEVLFKNEWLMLRNGFNAGSNKMDAYIIPTSQTKAVVTEMTSLVDVSLPSIVKPKVDKDSFIMRQSFKNKGKTIAGETTVDSVKYLSSVEYTVDVETLKYLLDNLEL